MRTQLLSLAFAAALALPALAGAVPLAAPEGPVVLTVSGAIANTNAGDEARFDLAMLEDLASRETITATPWYDSRRTFSGPLMSAILEAVGARGTSVRVRAINDYAIDIPIADAEAFLVIFATRIDGDILSVRDKGPLFVIYPFDENPDLMNETYFGRSVWQVMQLDVF